MAGQKYAKQRVRMLDIMLQIPTILFLVSFTILAVLHNLATWLHLYWQLVWLDIPMHIFGGAVVALGVCTLRDLRVLPAAQLSTVSVLAVVLVVAIFWEVFEAYAGVSLDPYDYLDTGVDIVMGLVGGFLGHYIGSKLSNF